jgi:hypothetical protein
MSGRGGRGRGNRGHRDGNRGGRSRGRGRGNSYASTAVAKHKGLCAALGNHVFDYGQKGAADQMRTTWEKIVHHVGTIYGHDISNELQNRKTLKIDEPTHTQAVLDKHNDREARRLTQQTRLTNARNLQRVSLQAAVAEGFDASAPMTLAVLENDIEEAAYQATLDLPIKLNDEETTQHSNEWRTYRERTSRLEKQRGQAFSMIRGQCMQVLLDKMKHDVDWTVASESYDPLILFKLIEKTVLAQTEDQYPYATVYEQECTLYSFSQNALSNEQWYERFNTRIDVGTAIGVTRQHRVLLEHVAAEAIPPTLFENMTPEQQTDTRDKAEERYLSYVFLRQSGKQHNKLKIDLQNDFTTGDDRYPKNRQATLHLLDKYSKSTVVSHTTPSEGTSFAQRGGRGGANSDRNSNTYDKKFWKDKTCYNCNTTGHPSTHCPDKDKKQKNDDDKSVSTRTSKSSKTSKATSISKAQKKLKKSFATLTSKIQELENEDSDISDSDDDDEEVSHFQTGTILMQTDFAFHQGFEQRNIDVLFKKRGPKLNNLALRNIILLDSQSTMDLFCNPLLVHSIKKSKKSMKLQSNGGTMTVNHKASITSYEHEVWFDKNAITNIIALSNLITQYRVTYDSNDKMFVVHRTSVNLPNMHFRMHSSGLHYYDPRDENFSFNIQTVTENKAGFTKRQLQGAELARTLYSNLGYPSMKDFKWVIQSSQIKDCPVTVDDVINANQIWGKNIAALKGKTTRSTP